MIDYRFVEYFNWGMPAVIILLTILAWPEMRRVWREEQRIRREERRPDAVLVTVTQESGEELVRDYRLAGPARVRILRLIGLL